MANQNKIKIPDLDLSKDHKIENINKGLKSDLPEAKKGKINAPEGEVETYKGIPFAPHKKVIVTETLYDIIIEEVWAEKRKTQTEIIRERVKTVPIVEITDIPEKGEPEYEQLYDEKGEPIPDEELPTPKIKRTEHEFGSREDAEAYAAEKEAERLEEITKEMAGVARKDQKGFMGYLRNSGYRLSKHVRAGLAGLMLMIPVGAAAKEYSQTNDQQKQEQRLTQEELDLIQSYEESSGNTIHGIKQYLTSPHRTSEEREAFLKDLRDKTGQEAGESIEFSVPTGVDITQTEKEAIPEGEAPPDESQFEVRTTFEDVDVKTTEKLPDTVEMQEVEKSVFEGGGIRIKSDRSPKFEAKDMSEQDIEKIKQTILNKIDSVLAEHNVDPTEASLTLVVSGMVSPEGNAKKNKELKDARGKGAVQITESQLDKIKAESGVEDITIEYDTESSDEFAREVNAQRDKVKDMFGLSSESELVKFFKAYNRGKLDLSKYSEEELSFLQSVMDEGRGAEVDVFVSGTGRSIEPKVVEGETVEKTVTVPVPKINVIEMGKGGGEDFTKKETKVDVKWKKVKMSLPPIEEKEVTPDSKQDPAILVEHHGVQDPQIHFERPAKIKKGKRVVRYDEKREVDVEKKEGEVVDVKRRVRRIRKDVPPPPPPPGDRETARGSLTDPRQSTKRDTLSKSKIGKGARGVRPENVRKPKKEDVRGKTGRQEKVDIHGDAVDLPREAFISKRTVSGKKRERNLKKKAWQEPRRKRRKSVRAEKEKELG